MKYGLPYKGSKNKIAEDIVAQLPSAKNFYDIFAGGCAITHCAMRSGKYQNFYLNDIKGMFPKYFIECLNGEHKDECRVIDRQTFQALKDTDSYVALCWSFGNNGMDYLWGKDIEQLKLTACNMLMAPTIPERRRFYMSFVKQLQTSQPKGRVHELERLQGLERLEGLEGLERLEGLEGLERLEGLESCYTELSFAPNSVIYADPPYMNTKGYGTKFNHEQFWNWCREQSQPVYISEYTAPGDFVPIWSKETTSKYCATSSKKATENLFIHKKWLN